MVVKPALPLVLLIAFLAGCAEVPPSPKPTNTEEVPESQPVSITVQRDLVRVTLALEHATIETGTAVLAHVDVTNLGPDPVTWQSGGCELLGDMRMAGPEIAQPAPGKDWGGTAGLAKWSATTGGIGVSSFTRPGLPDDGPGNVVQLMCTMELRIEDIQPGASERVDAEWKAVLTDGSPAPPGVYTAGFDFPFLARVAAGQFEGDAMADRRPISAEVKLTVGGRAFAGLSPIAAVDQAFGDPRVQAWIADVTRLELNGATVRMIHGIWVFEIYAQGGNLRVRVDPTTGQVVDVSPFVSPQ